MSPFLYLENTVIQELNEEDQCTYDNTCSSKETKVSPVIKWAFTELCTGEPGKESTSVRSNEVDVLHSEWRKHIRNKKSKNKTSNMKDMELKEKYFTSKNNMQTKNSRVPPITSDEVLSYSLESLNLNCQINQISCAVSRERCKSELNFDKALFNNSCISGSSNNVSPPPMEYSTIYRCLACGIEMSSIQNLANHLIKHILEGIQAASWLNYAMSALPVNSNQISNTSSISKSNSLDVVKPKKSTTVKPLESSNS